MSTSVMYGAYAAAFGIVVMLVEHFTGIDVTPTAQWFGLIGTVGLIVCMVMAMKTRKTEEFGGGLSYGQGVGTGTLVALVSGVILGIYTYIHMTYIAPEVVTYMRDTARAKMLVSASGNQAQVDQGMKYAEMFMGPAMQAVFVIIGSTLMGLVIALIASIFVKENAPQQDQAIAA